MQNFSDLLLALNDRLTYILPLNLPKICHNKMFTHLSSESNEQICQICMNKRTAVILAITKAWQNNKAHVTFSCVWTSQEEISQPFKVNQQ